jgi:hypothetical protein
MRIALLLAAIGAVLWIALLLAAIGAVLLISVEGLMPDDKNDLLLVAFLIIWVMAIAWILQKLVRGIQAYRASRRFN